MAVSANANNWWYIDTSKDGVEHYLDASSLQTVDQNSQIVTAFIRMKGMENLNSKIENKTIYSSSIKYAFDCRNERSTELSSIFYGVKGAVVHSDNDIGQFTPIHPGTSHYLDMYAVCTVAGFKGLSKFFNLFS